MPPVPPRLQRLFEHASDVDAILIINDAPDATFQWATGLHHGGTFEGSAAILRPGEVPLVLVPPLEETTASKGLGDVQVFSGRDGFQHALVEELAGADRIGLNFQKISIDRHRKLADRLGEAIFKDVHPAIQAARLIKDQDELEAMREACKLTDRIADGMEDHVAQARTESELAALLVKEILTEGARLSFDPIVAWGASSAEPHYAPHPVPLRDGPLLVDMGAKLNGYCSDITRTYTIGPADQRFVRMHETCEQALMAALDTIEPGAKGGAVHKAAAAIIDDSEFQGRFIHTVGHSLGVEVHDGSRLHTSQDLTLEEGMVFTVEPGIYVPDVAGVRLEEDIVVTRDGCRQLTQADRELRDVSV